MLVMDESPDISRVDSVCVIQTIVREEESAGPTGHAGVNVSTEELEDLYYKRASPPGHCVWLAEWVLGSWRQGTSLAEDWVGETGLVK